MGKPSEKGISDSSKRRLECFLERPGLEELFTSDELAEMLVDDRGRVPYVERLHEYAERFPKSRETIASAFGIYAKKNRGTKRARAVGKREMSILALTMLETLCE